MHCGDMDSFVLCGSHGLNLGPFSGRFKKELDNLNLHIYFFSSY